MTVPDVRETPACDPTQVLREVHPPSSPLPNAKEFIHHTFNHRQRPLLVHHGGTFRNWDGSCWPEVEESALRAELYRFFGDAWYVDAENHSRDFSPTRHKVADLVDALKAAAHLRGSVPVPSWLDGAGPAPATDLIPVANGLVDVHNRTLHSPTPNLFVTHSVPYEFDPNAAPPTRWLQFLDELWPDDPESIQVLQELFGYILAGDTRQQKMFLLVGPKRAGKGTIARVLSALVGVHNVAGVTLAALSTNFGMSPLVDRPLAVISDARLRSDDSIITERLLAVSGEDTMTVDRKYREPWTGQLPTRFMLLSNELPRLADASGALASRFIVLTLERSFYDKENTRLTDELLAELPGIFNWALDGLERLRDRGRFIQPKSAGDAIQEMADLSSPISAFLRDECVVGSGETVALKKVYQAWREWCEAHGRDHPGTEQTFGRDLRAAVPGLRTVQPRGDDGKQYRAYVGLRLQRPGDVPELSTPAHNEQNRVSLRVSDQDAPNVQADSGLTRDDTRVNPLWSQVPDDPVKHVPPAEPCEQCGKSCEVLTNGQRLHAPCAAKAGVL